jgi:hypothetical protein
MLSSGDLNTSKSLEGSGCNGAAREVVHI